MNSIVRSVYRRCLNVYDWMTSDKIEISVGDIMLQRGDVVLNNQLLLTSRYCDVLAYCDEDDKTFPHQNTISRKAYGEKHKEERGNKKFASLIKSYQDSGYNPISEVTVDKDIVLMDGNHRMGLHIYEKIDKVNIRRVHRKPPYQYGVDWYYRQKLSSGFLEKLHKKYAEIQRWLIESGNTFCIYVQNSEILPNMNVVEDISRLCKVLNVLRINGGGIFVQFSMSDPNYSVVKKCLVSQRACQIENVLKQRYGNEMNVLVSKNCLEGKELIRIYNNTL